MMIKKKQFMKDYANLSMKDMCAKYGGVSNPTIVRLVKKYGGKVKQQGGQQKIELV